MSNLTKRRIKWVVMNAMLVASLIMGVFYDSEGFKNIALFLIWLTVIASLYRIFESPSLESAVSSTVELVMEKGGPAANLFIEAAFDICVTLILVWGGYITTAVFYAIHAAFVAMVYEEMAKSSTASEA